jgi:alkylation response protein AidB-like acyl-CoA dehydrogenase
MTANHSPHDQAQRLREAWTQQPATAETAWPVASWNDCRAAGILRWNVPEDFGGDGQPAPELLDGCLELARGQLLVTFILSQFQAACQRLADRAPPELRRRWLPRLATGECFTTVGLSHLTTSRQHAIQPPVIAEAADGGYQLTGEIPWVTGARRADVLVVGGTLADGRQILVALPGDRSGVACAPPLKLLALEGSETGPVRLDHADVHADEIIAGPVPQILHAGGVGGAGSLTTSALALGHAQACVDRLAEEAESRPNLSATVSSLARRADELRGDLLAAANNRAAAAQSAESLRTRATELALHASQALLTASKGAGFIAGHPAERLAREALFFLVWSCPQAVAGQLLQGFGGCAEE